MKGKNNKIYWLIGLLVIGCIGGVFAYWTQELLVHNEFRTGRYDTTIEEEFVPPENWKPGEETNKDVWIANKGDVPAFVKVTVHQEWIRKDNVTDADGNVVLPAAGEKIPLVFETPTGKAYAAQIAWGGQVVLLKSGKKSSLDLGLDVVDSVSEAKGKWLLVSDEPDSNGDFLLYYIGVINEKKNSPLIVDSVTMNPLIQPAVLRKDTYYDKANEQWITELTRNNTYDYECARYTMVVNGSTVQATKSAVKEVFGTDSDVQEIVEYLATLAPNLTKYD